MTGKQQPLYRTYLVRCWQEGKVAPGRGPHWRSWVEEISRERREKGFSSGDLRLF